jgi:hypothetical protein
VTGNPWVRLPRSEPFVLAEDALYLDAWNRANDDRPGVCVDLDRPAEPFMGLHAAGLVVLQANPRSGSDDHLAWDVPGLADRAVESAGAPGGQPFFWLADDLQDTPGGRWWRRCLSGVLEVCPAGVLASQVLAVEFHGYHSRNWQALPVTLLSQQFGFGLVQDAVGRGAVIVVLRAWREWQVAVPALSCYAGVVQVSSHRRALVSQGNVKTVDDWQRIVGALS